MSEIEKIDQLATYYRGFHHSCITWYTTVMGFFLAGLIATGQVNNSAKLVWVPIFASSTAFAIIFFYCIFHYSSRIKYLQSLIEGPEDDIPSTWRKEHRKQRIQIKGQGVGSYFFLMLIIIMQVTVWSLLVINYS